MNRFSRRTLLKAAGGVSFALPLLPSLARGDESAFPKRFIFFYHPNGTLPSGWWPKDVQNESQFTLNQIHEPLAPHQADLLIMKGVHLRSPSAGPGEPHQKGMGGLLTGRALLPGTFAGGDGSLAGWGSGISVDQRIAQVIGTTTKERSLQLGVRVHESEVRTRFSYSGAGQALPLMQDPVQVFDLLFSERQTPSPDLEKLRKRRASVLDAVKPQFAALTPKLGSADRQKLEQHFELVRDLESRLASIGQACGVPGRPPVQESDSPVTMPDITRLQIDLLVAALACDITRVGSLMLCGAVDAVNYPWLSSQLDGHSLSHLGDSDTRKPQVVTRDRWTAEQLAYLITQLKAIPEGNGTMFDNTLILWGSEISVGNTHSQEDMPFLLAGHAGKLRTGRYLQFNGKSHNDLLVSALNAMGVPDATFGDPNFCTGPLPGLT